MFSLTPNQTVHSAKSADVRRKEERFTPGNVDMLNKADTLTRDQKLFKSHI